jgi:hypothetical protein
MLPGYPYWSDRVIVRISWNNYLKALCIVKHTMKKKAVLLSSLCSRLVAKGPLWMSGNAGLTATSYMPSHSLSLHWHLLLWNSFLIAWHSAQPHQESSTELIRREIGCVKHASNASRDSNKIAFTGVRKERGIGVQMYKHMSSGNFPILMVSLWANPEIEHLGTNEIKFVIWLKLSHYG